MNGKKPSDPKPIERSGVVAARAPAFVHHPFLAKLVRHRLDLLEEIEGMRLGAGLRRIQVLRIAVVVTFEQKAFEQVGARPIHVGKEVNVARGGVGTRPIVLKVVAGERDAVLVAPSFERQGEVLHPQSVEGLVEIESCRSAGRRVKVKICQDRLDRVVVTPQKLGLDQTAEMQPGPPRPVRIRCELRLVGEDRRTGFPVLRAELVPVTLVSGFQKGLRRFWVEQARVRKFPVPRHRRHPLHHKRTPSSPIL